MRLSFKVGTCQTYVLYSSNSETFEIGGLECGGAYMKLLQDNKALKTDEFSNASPYIIMFGPDKCGSTNKVSILQIAH